MKTISWRGTRIYWVYAAVAVTCACGLVYLVAQQNYREGLNDPQIQLAEDAALSLQGGATPESLIPQGAARIDTQKSLSPWLVICDASGAPIQSSATYGGVQPTLPKGLFDTSTWSKAKMYTQNGMQETRVTWQPESGVRQAVVLVRVSNGMFVASGRNMREVEQRIEHLGEMVFAAWVVTLGVLLVVSFVYRFI